MSYDLARKMLREEGLDIRGGHHIIRSDQDYFGAADPAIRGFLDDIDNVVGGLDALPLSRSSSDTSEGTSEGTSDGTSGSSDDESPLVVQAGAVDPARSEPHESDESPLVVQDESPLIARSESRGSQDESPLVVQDESPRIAQETRGGIDSLTFNSAPPSPRASGGSESDSEYILKKNVTFGGVQTMLSSQIGDIYF